MIVASGQSDRIGKIAKRTRHNNCTWWRKQVIVDTEVTPCHKGEVLLEFHENPNSQHEPREVGDHGQLQGSEEIALTQSFPTMGTADAHTSDIAMFASIQIHGTTSSVKRRGHSMQCTTIHR